MECGGPSADGQPAEGQKGVRPFSCLMVWGSRDLFLAGARWGRRWANRATYAHPYSALRAWAGPRGAEQHKLMGGSAKEGKAAREGRAVREEHGAGR